MQIQKNLLKQEKEINIDGNAMTADIYGGEKEEQNGKIVQVVKANTLICLIDEGGKMRARRVAPEIKRTAKPFEPRLLQGLQEQIEEMPETITQLVEFHLMQKEVHKQVTQADLSKIFPNMPKLGEAAQAVPAEDKEN